MSSPVPHSAITAALRSVSHFLATPIAATVWAGKGFRSKVAIRGETGSCALCSAGKLSRHSIAQLAGEHAEIVLH